ncbi:MAG: oligoendopeptidase F [Ignavibacteriaceae bacterium]|nr:oligoendopeptidase F [Ignavibacteriaceae bacterium]
MTKYYSENGAVLTLTRDQINEKYKWNLRDIYSSDDEWENNFAWVEISLGDYDNFRGKLKDSPQILLSCFQFDDEVGIKLERLYLYAMLNKDSDMSVSVYQAMDSRVKTLYSKVSAANSFINPELLKIPDEILLNMIHSLEGLKIYEHSVNELLRKKVHTLNKEEEEILAMAAEIAQIPHTSFSLFTNADMKFEKILDDNGNEIEISQSKFYASLYSPNREFRERSFKTYLKPFSEYAITLSSLFNGNLKVNIFNAKARKYSSAREAALDANNIPLSVYDNLVQAANDNLKPLHRWAELKKKMLKLNELHPYDVYVSLFSANESRKYQYDEGVEIVCNALQPLGSNYIESLKLAFNNRWIDIYESRSKKSGAYSSGTTFGVHPYVLLNWTDLLNDVFTLAHEMGHNMHSYFTGMNQPYPYANYSIFLAEVASTFNESLLLDYLISNSDSKENKLFLLEKYLNNITATFYRQTMFAEFEMNVYSRTENGEALTHDLLCNMYRDIYQKYWGPAMVIDKEEEYTWARVPHFYYNFYVYQYATGFAASEVLANKVKYEKKSAVDKYLLFLKSGSSDYSINILKNAGVDMNSSESVIAATKKMDQLLDEVEKLLI